MSEEAQAGDWSMAADGNWNLVIETPMGERQATLSVKTEGSLLKGSQSAEGRSMDIFDGAAKGNEVSWKVSITDPMDMTLEFTGAVEGDRMSGSVKLGPFGDAAPAPSRALRILFEAEIQRVAGDIALKSPRPVHGRQLMISCVRRPPPSDAAVPRPNLLVEPRGFEPLTSAVRLRRSPN
jgi:hypothetical protein